MPSKRLFAWDPDKAFANLALCRISFEIGTRVFADPFAIEWVDERREYGDRGVVAVGMIDGRPVTASCMSNEMRLRGLSPSNWPPSPSEMTNASATSDLAHLATLTDDEIEALAFADPDNPPLSDADIQRLPRTPRVTMIRRALGLTPAEFSARFRIPLAELDDWEQRRSAPDEIASAYLFVIASDPAAVDRAFAPLA